MKKIYIIPDAADIERSIALSELYGAGFEYNDFSYPEILDDEGEVERRISFYRSLDRDRGDDMLHGAFLDVTVHSADPLIRAVSDKRVRKSMDIAAALGIRGVVFHTNFIPNFRSEFYVDGWIERNASYWRAIAEEYGELDIYMENMFDSDPEMLFALAERLRDVKNFGVCLDVAHTNVFGDGSAEWIRRLAPYIAHVHINDNDKREDLHAAIGTGKLDFSLFDREIRGIGRAPSVLVEIRDHGSQRLSMEYLKEHGIYPFD